MEKIALSLREEYGYTFSYRGDGIDAQDRKEITQALQKIEPLLKLFQQPNFKPDHQKATNLAFDINTLLPKPKSNDHENFLKEKLFDTMDAMLHAFEAAEEMRQFAKDVFDMLEQQMKGIQFYA